MTCKPAVDLPRRSLLIGRLCAEVDAASFSAEDREHLHRVVECGHPVRDPRVELSGLTGAEDDFPASQDEPQSPGQQVHPFVTVVSLQVRDCLRAVRTGR